MFSKDCTRRCENKTACPAEKDCAANAVIICTASALRCKKLLNTGNLCLSEGITKDRKCNFCRKMILKNIKIGIADASRIADKTESTI